eukprot:scaffold244365_cov17-Prasinocladus_malaysianus.AAC.1
MANEIPSDTGRGQGDLTATRIAEFSRAYLRSSSSARMSTDGRSAAGSRQRWCYSYSYEYVLEAGNTVRVLVF